MSGESSLERLPDEILLEIIAFLEPKDIAAIQVLSKKLLKICRDNNFWRARCLEESPWLDGMRSRRDLLYSDDPPDEPPVFTHYVDRSSSGDLSREMELTAKKKESKRILANWDPEFPGESVYWYEEYIHRTAPIATNWLEQPQLRDGSQKLAIEVKGVALYKPNQAGSGVFAVSPLDDGSVCLWDVKGQRRSKGAILSKSASDLLRVDGPRTDLSRRSKMINIGATDCVSVDSQRNRAFFAVQSHLIEVDLQTMQLVRNQPYEWTITTLSTSDPGLPLTVGTFNGIHLHDSRAADGIRPERQELIDDFDRQGLRNVLDPDPSPLPLYAPLAQSGPLSILHLEEPGTKGLISDDIFVSGRFSNILHYDRRMFPGIRDSIYSGARLSGLASLPYPFSSLHSELRRHGELSTEQAETSKQATGERTLIACGEYNTKGSLEVYGLSSRASQSHASHGVSHNSVFKNRQTASKSKLLSVINHGTRILFSDGQGYLKWVERDAFTEVRRHKIGHAERPQERSLFASMPGSDELARKLLSTGQGDDSRANDDDVLFWTGEKLGLVSFSSKPGFAADEFDEATKTPEEVAAEKQEQLYGERMRAALERQANDVRFVSYLGSGVQNGF